MEEYCLYNKKVEDFLKLIKSTLDLIETNESYDLIKVRSIDNENYFTYRVHNGKDFLDVEIDLNMLHAIENETIEKYMRINSKKCNAKVFVDSMLNYYNDLFSTPKYNDN